MQPQFTQNVPRERPLQKSMFLPQTQQYTQRNSNEAYQYQDIMKRSAILNDNLKPMAFQENQKPNNFIDNSKQQSFQFANYAQNPVSQYNNGQMANYSNGVRYKETSRMGQYEHQQVMVQQQMSQPTPMTQSNLMPSSHSQPQMTLAQLPGIYVGPETVLQQLQQRVNQLTVLVESHDETIKKHQTALSQPPQQKDHSHLITNLSQQLQTRLRQSIIPTIISKQTKQIYQHIFDFKLQIQTIKQEIISVNDSFKSQIATILNKNKSNSTLNSSQKLDKVEESSSSEVGANNMLLNLENKIAEVQKIFGVKNDQLRTFMLVELQKVKKQTMNHQLSSTKMKSSTIKSTLPPIMIEYREIFFAKNSSEKRNVTRTHVPTSRTKDETQIIINSSTYFIDSEGYLLDSQNRYIIDYKGQQIKLEEKHLSLLKEHNILA